MTESDYQEALLMRDRLVNFLAITQEQIIAYPPRSNDEDFQFLIRKAIYYQELIDRIDRQLNALDD